MAYSYLHEIYNSASIPSEHISVYILFNIVFKISSFHVGAFTRVASDIFYSHTHRYTRHKDIYTRKHIYT